jgi:hypothetical protein
MMPSSSLWRSPALVSAGLMVSGSAGAQQVQKRGIEVGLGGSTEFGVVAANENTITADRDRSYTFSWRTRCSCWPTVRPRAASSTAARSSWKWGPAACEAKCEGTDDGGGFNDQQKSWAVGGLLDFAGFTLGAGYNRQDDFAPETQDNDIVNLGLKYGSAVANVSFGYTFNQFGDDDLDDSHLFVVSGDLGLLPGVTLLADLAYNTKDLEATSNGVAEQDDTVSGIASLQLDY